MLAAFKSWLRPGGTAKALREEAKFFEVFGDALSETIFLRNLAIVLGGACLVLCIAVLRLASKPPMVIRVDALSEPAAITDARHAAYVTAPEVRNFAEHFTRNLLAWDLYTFVDDIDRALAMMTPEAAAKMKSRLDGLNTASAIREDSLRTTVAITEIEVEKDTPSVVRVKVRGTRTSQSYEKKAYRKETSFEDTLVAGKVARSAKTPWGLLVAEWSEAIYEEKESK
jgi:type IV secretory pathway TrbF-like protein